MRRALRQGITTWLARGSPDALPVAQHALQLGSHLLHHNGGATCSLPGSHFSSAVQPAQLVNSYGFAATAISAQPVLPGENYDLYTVRIATGNLRGAGTQSAAYIQLTGANGRSERALLSVDDVGTFDRGSVRTFKVPVPKHLGKLQHVRIEKSRGRLDISEGWYLQHIEIESPKGDRVLFPCNSWLGESDCGGYHGPNERDLSPELSAAAAAAREADMPVAVRAAGTAIPHPEKVLKRKQKGYNTRGFGYGGEDAYFFCSPNERAFGMGVADGIYMWRDKGVDSGVMSRALMNQCRDSIMAGYLDASAVLSGAVEHIHSQEIQGSATVCLLTVDCTTGLLRSANLGDSGFLVYGPQSGGGYGLKFRTAQLEHQFGYPYQIGSHAESNKAEDADVAVFHVRPGDVVVMGSDGLLDNVSDTDIAAEVAAALARGASMSELVQRLTKLAFDASMDKHRVTPYSKGASEAFDMVYSGGKPDDITVLAAVVS